MVSNLRDYCIRMSIYACLCMYACHIVSIRAGDIMCNLGLEMVPCLLLTSKASLSRMIGAVCASVCICLSVCDSGSFVCLFTS